MSISIPITSLGLCVGVTGTVSLSEPVSVLSSDSSPLSVRTLSGSLTTVLHNGTPVGPNNPVPVVVSGACPCVERVVTGSYQALAYGTSYRPGGELLSTVASIHNSGSRQVYVRRALASVSVLATGSAMGPGWLLGGRTSGQTLSGTAVASTRLNTAMPLATAVVYSGPVDLSVASPMCGAAFPASFPHYPSSGGFASGSFMGPTFEVELLAGRSDPDDLVLAPGEAFAAVVDLQALSQGNVPTVVWAVSLAWDEGS